MKRKFSYGIGFLCSAALLSAGYYFSYEASVQEEASPGSGSESIEADTSQTPRYVLRASGGYVCVYLAADSSLYENTWIEVRTLPQSVQEALADGIYLKSEVDLYGFLESNSS